MRDCDDNYFCDECEKEVKALYARGIKEFCSLECTNRYLEHEGFSLIKSSDESKIKINKTPKR